MCSVVILRRPWHSWPVIFAANRDEMTGRPSRPPGRHWPERGNVVAGMDVEAGGSWLGLNDHGVLAAVLNRVGSLGPAAGKRSRGELVLRSLEATDARAAAAAMAALDASHYRSFNLVIADRSSAWWLKHADAADSSKPACFQLGAGLSMVTAHDLNDGSSPRISGYRPRFKAASAPDPDAGDWRAWQDLLASRDQLGHAGPDGAMTIVTGRGFGTVSSSLIALPSGAAQGPVARRPTWLYAPGRPDRTGYQMLQFDEASPSGIESVTQ